MSSPIQKPPTTEGSSGGHTITVKLGGPAVESYTREDFIRDLRKVSRKEQPKP